MKKTLMGGGYVAPEMTLYATPVEKGFENTYGEAGYAGDGLGINDDENNYGGF